MFSNPAFQLPSTPRKRDTALFNSSYQPSRSSPLVSSPISPNSSPVPAAQARRRSQYKYVASESPSSSRQQPRRTSLKSVGNLFSSGATTALEEPPQKALLRERFKARCFERARKAREKAVTGKRRRAGDSELSSDGIDADMDYEDEEENGDEMLNDELFRRIMETVERKTHHSYRVSYQWEVGSSVDPDMEDVSRWEQELRDEKHDEKPKADVETAPVDLDEEELAAYAEEAALLEDLELYADDIFSFSDEEDTPGPANVRRNEKQTLDTDFDMDTT